MNLVTPAISTPAGHIVAGVNYEPDIRGTARTRGFERRDGRPKPSEQTYYTLSFDSGSVQPQAGETITGATSAATGIALYTVTAATGSYGGGDATGELVLTQVSGTFQDNEDLNGSTGGANIATANGAAAFRGASTSTLDDTYLQAAIEKARTDIARPAGSGPVRGVWVYKGDEYCVRDNAGATAGVLYKATSSGWAAQDLGRELAFTSGGTTEILAGNIVQGATSGATAIVRRVIVTSGTWAGGDAAGRLIVNTQSGTFQSENLDISGGASNVATIAGDSTENALPAGGRYEFVNHNFYGASNLKRMYGVNGVGKAFEWDGTVLVFINTGMTIDVPSRIGVFRNHLMLSFDGGFVQNSSIGDPLAYVINTGSSVISMGDDVTQMLNAVDNAMIIFARNRVGVLYGDDANNFRLDILSDVSGAIAWSAVNLHMPLYVDDGGLRSLQQTEAFGDFRMGSLTQLVEPIFRKKRNAGVTLKASTISKRKDQYRLFWSDGTGLVVYFGRKAPESIPFDFGSTVIECAVSAEKSDGSEIILLGDNDGWVYEYDAGTSFDGSAISAYARFAFNHLGTPTQNKRFHKATIEMEAAANTTLALTAEFSHGEASQPPAPELDFTVSGSGGFWDQDEYSGFYWSSRAEGQAEAHINGIGTNCSITVVHTSTYEEPHTLQALTLNYTPRRMVR
jgi:hypothetical protein